jgi:hypothetical protein
MSNFNTRVLLLKGWVNFSWRFWVNYTLALIAQTTQTEKPTEPLSQTLPMPQVTPKPTKRRVGQRAPQRDPVGEASAPLSRQTTGCPFAEEIPVTLSQMEEAGVFRFECPNCLATQTIKPKGDRVKFSWHPKRTTNTPNRGMYWVKREHGWRLAEGVPSSENGMPRM